MSVSAAPNRRQQARPELPAAPLGPASITWRHFGDARHLLLTGRTGVLQTMHPAISQALLDHSDYFDDPIDRIARSAGPILGVVYDADGDGTGRRVRDMHRTIRSDRPSGAGASGYRALDPDVFYWAHATFVEAVMTGRELFGRAMSREERRQLYAESVTWYRRYGMSMRPVPSSLEAFEEYWEHMVRDVLKATPVAVQAVRRSRFPQPPVGVPQFAWRPAEPVFALAAQWLTVGALPEPARRTLGARWSAPEQAAFNAAIGAVRSVWPLVPPRLRWLPEAREGFDRAGAPLPPARR